MLGRAALRRAEGRPAGDHPERLRVYREKTAPLVGFYRDRGLLIEVDGVGEVQEVSERIHRALSPAEGPFGPPELL